MWASCRNRQASGKQPTSCGDHLRASSQNLSDDDWAAFAQRTFKHEGGRIVPDYDVKLATTLEAADLDQPLLVLWKQFDALAGVPVMVIRGGNSDLLSATTVEAMRARRTRLDTVEVPDQGHAPLLTGDDLIGRIAAFVRACDGGS
jgi:pimeloyl-ACP methyl ester carboxylesterase